MDKIVFYTVAKPGYNIKELKRYLIITNHSALALHVARAKNNKYINEINVNYI